MWYGGEAVYGIAKAGNSHAWSAVWLNRSGGGFGGVQGYSGAPICSVII